MKSTRKAARRRRRSLRRNPLSPRGKVLALGGIVAAGGLAAYALSRPSSTQPSGGSPTPSPAEQAAGKAAECAALQTGLMQLRAQATPDRASMLQLEAQLATCLSQAREMGVPVDPSSTHQSSGDALYAQIEGWWSEYKATSDHDPLKRNNTRQSILTAGGQLASIYVDALTQSPNVATTKLIAQSIVRALDSAITRQLCFLGNERGCGTFGSNEDQPDAKAAQEQERVIAPLLAAYAQAVVKVGGPTRALVDADGAKFLEVTLRPCAFLKGFIDGQFEHYKATLWSDALKRNNTRRDMLASSRNLTACLQGVFTSAQNFGSLTALRAVGSLTVAALNSAIDRWSCYFTGGTGCGTFGVNEDQPNVKAAQEMDASVTPLMALYAQIARALVARRDVTAFEPLVTAKLRVCSTLKGFIDGQFEHYKATSWSDALKRNNTRAEILATGGALAACLRDTLATALNAGSAAPKTGTAGLGQFITYLPITQTQTRAMTPTISTTLVSMPAPQVDRMKMVRQVGAATAAAFDAAVLRKLCYLYDQTGCGRFGLNEPHGNDKAADEQSRVIGPLIAVYKEILLADKDNAQVETPIMRSLIREVDARKNFIDAQYNHLKATNYIDPVQRNNTRDAIIASGRDMLALLRNAKPVTPAGRALLRASAQAALAKSAEREACYRAGAPGCDRQWGTWTEPSGGEKADQELAEIKNPLTALLADRSPNGLGSLGDEPVELSTAAWIGIGLVGGVIAYNMFQKPVRQNPRRQRRTSHRAA